ncbi:MAG: energy-coupling factor transporter transmembrane protein EcfT [candidate division Zixibacteria bacterium]|nr:energy-coupling factor transporter transmembrane protein EcfT [candidate division Zixibacteria bacterium]
MATAKFLESGNRLNGSFIFGQYKSYDSFGHRLDPRAKILFGLFLMILALFTQSVLFYSIMIIGLISILRISKIGFGLILKNVGPFIVLVSVTALYHLIFSSRGSAEIVNLFGFSLTSGGIEMAVVFSLRVILFVIIAFFMALTIAPSEMGESLVYFIRPLKKLKIPVNDIGLILFIAMRFIPVLAEEFETIKKAQIVRGVDYSGGLITRAKKALVLLIPVFLSAIRRADDLAVAIESRGYISGTERSSLRDFRFLGRDWFFIVVSIGLTLLIFVITEGF